MAGLLFNKYKGDMVRVLLVRVLREILQALGEIMLQVKQGLLNVTIVRVKGIWQGSALSLRGQGILHGSRKRYCDDISSAKTVLMANLSSYDSDVLSEVPSSDIYQNDMANQSVQEMQYFEQTLIGDYPDNEITSDSNIIPYSQYLQETQHAVVQDTNSSVQQDSIIISMFEKMSEQMSNHVTKWDKANLETKTVNESLTAELERYKERVKTFKQRLNIDLSSHEKFIDSQMDDMIRNRNALKKEIDSFKQTISKHVKEKESLLQTFIVFKK
ncbi:hypothetical protein Tco_0435289 [Tanacetum coccineum]